MASTFDFRGSYGLENAVDEDTGTAAMTKSKKKSVVDCKTVRIPQHQPYFCVFRHRNKYVCHLTF